MTEFDKLSNTQKWLYGIIAGAGMVIGSYFLYKKAKPYLEIREYNKNPNIKKPRKWRRILRRKKQKYGRK